MARQQRRKLPWLLCGVFFGGMYHLWSTQVLSPLSVPFDQHATYMNQRRDQIVFTSEQSYDWTTAPFIQRIEQHVSLPSGTPHQLPRVQYKFEPFTRSRWREREARRLAVRAEFKRVWESYRELAWKRDELQPISGRGLDDFGGWGATLVDSLDTLWIMGFKDYFHEAVQAVAAIDFGKSDTFTISVFETTIRYLGGLLSAYDLSHEPVLLEKAIQVGEMLYRAFDTTNNTPLAFLNIEDAKNIYRGTFPAERKICFACLGSLSMEFTRLAQITAEPKYYDVIFKLSLLLVRTQNSTKVPGLWPTYIDAATEDVNSGIFSIGALADSAYEYFPKMHALLGGLEPEYEKLFNTSAAMMDKYTFFRPTIPNESLGADLLFCGDISVPDVLGSLDSESVHLEPELQHLTCFIGGMFGLAGRLFQNTRHVDLGAKLTNGCIFAYSSMSTGIMPESFSMMPCGSRAECPWNATAWEEVKARTCAINRDVGSPDFGMPESDKKCGLVPGFSSIRDKRYLLRPEAIESVFIMHRITGNHTYVDRAWDMFKSIVKATRTRFANGQLYDVTLEAPGTSREGGRTREGNIEDKMESFWTAETLKYFYLIFSRPDMISLDDWVFNTEAHPFRRPKASKTRGKGWEWSGLH